MARDPADFDEFYRTRRDDALAQLISGGADADVARHALQVAFGRAWGRWSSLASANDPESWVLATAGKALTRRRRAPTQAAEFDGTSFAEPGAIRNGVDRRAHRSHQLVAVAVIALLVVAGSLAYVLRAQPAGVPAPVALTANPTPSTPTSPAPIPDGLFLSQLDTQFVERDSPTGQVPNSPFHLCGIDHAPDRADLMTASTASYLAPGAAGEQTITEQIMEYQPGTAQVGLNHDVPDWLAGSCKSTFSQLATGFAGDASILMSYVGPPSAAQGSQIVDEALVAVGDYLIWLTFQIDPTAFAEPAFVEQVAERVAYRVRCGPLPDC